jgi:hypothetical protein
MDTLPEGCVDLFVAETESSDEEEGEEDDSPGLSTQNVWRKVRGRLKNDMNDFAASGARPLPVGK